MRAQFIWKAILGRNITKSICIRSLMSMWVPLGTVLAAGIRQDPDMNVGTIWSSVGHRVRQDPNISVGTIWSGVYSHRNKTRQ